MRQNSSSAERAGQTLEGPCSSAPRRGGELELEVIARGAGCGEEASELDPESGKQDGGELDPE